MKYEKVEFNGGKVPIDGATFLGCRFKDAVLVYSATAPAVFDHCSFEGARWQFDGAAANMVDFMRTMYEGPFRPVIENTISVITGKIAMPGPLL